MTPLLRKPAISLKLSNPHFKITLEILTQLIDMESNSNTEVKPYEEILLKASKVFNVSFIAS